MRRNPMARITDEAGRYRRVKDLGEQVAGVVWFAGIACIIAAICWWTFSGLHKLLLGWGLTASIYGSGLVWLLIGVACAFFWPVRYWDGMRGNWRSYIPWGIFYSVAGPWALLLSIPL